MKTLVLLVAFFCSASLFGADSTQLRGDALRQYLIGTWADNDADPNASSEQTFRKDGTYEGSVVFREKDKSGSMIEHKLTFSGVWTIEGDICVETTLKMDPEITKLGEPHRYRISEASPSKHRSTDVDTNESSVSIRKPANQSSQPMPLARHG